MIYITGDTHIPVDIQRLSSKNFPRGKEMTKNDYVIIAGDFGGVWDGTNEEKYWIKWLKEKSFSVLFVDGNHENFDMLKSLPEIPFCGGMVHKVDDGIYHLMRGEVYVIEGKKIFTFGGASSHDKDIRTEGKNWWKDELPSNAEMEQARKKLSDYDFSVDYVITHASPTSVQEALFPSYETNCLTDFLEEIKGRLNYKKWFFGHYHKDIRLDEKHMALFNGFEKI